MRAKTKLQKLVVRLSNSLPRISLTQMRYANKHALDHFVFINKSGTHNCMDCGHSWKGKTIDKSPQWHKDIVKEYVNCPSCNEKLLKIGTQARTETDNATMLIITVCKGFQVFRMFQIKSMAKTKTIKQIWHNELGQIWLAPDGKAEYVGQNYGGYTGNFWGSFELRHKDRVDNINFTPYVVYPKIKIIDEVYRNGYYDELLGFKPFDLFQGLLISNIAETLLKEDEFLLLKKLIPFSPRSRVVKYWDSIKIALRHLYTIEDVDSYLDYLDFLVEDNKDIRSPKYLCPRDFHKEHQRYVAKRIKKRISDRIKRDAQDRERERLKAIIRIKDYKTHISKFLHLQFKLDKEIIIRPLKNLKEIEYVGETLHHCIYSPAYYDDSNTLLMCAYNNGIPIETSQIDLLGLRVEQSRGLQNKDTIYTNQIIDLLNANMDLIKKAIKPKRKKRITKKKAA